ncbi:hypothetical protein L596_015099 [Steinernema carpocapsae]|uniref:KNTC1 first ARM-repeats domain-containing protein n=1 Tax=Steinernema carpocapsae TaxID=34508 RepID=A0A4U5NF95_STECR|nr:hypothetical protein L596_015099 [Steinernema carpocapsae]
MREIRSSMREFLGPNSCAKMRCACQMCCSDRHDGMRFTHIKDFDDDDVVTRNFAKEYNAEKSLYEVATLAAVSADAETLEEGFDLGECSVTACASKNSLAVAVRHDLSLFDVGMKATFRFTVDTKETVVGMSWLPKVDILLVVLSDGRFLFVNPSSEMSATYNAVDLEERQLQQCKVTTSMHGSVCLVVLSECTGFMFVVHIPGYADVIDSKQSPERFVDLFHAAASHIVVPCDYLFEKPVFHVPMESYFGLCLPAEDEEPPRIVTCSGDTETLCFDEFEEAAFCDGFVTVKRCGQFLFALMATNKIVVYEEATFMQVARWDLGYKDSVVDFFFADLADDLSNFEDCKVFLTISGKHGSKLDVAKVGSNELLYSVGISNNAFIVPEAGTDVGLVLIEPFPLDKPSVFVHSVVESLPELRLEKLLKTRRFEEAVQFAKSFSLDLQKVYRAVMHDALDKLYSSDDPDDKLYQNVLKSFDAVEDSNEIADLCTNAVSVLERFDWVIGFLKYVEKRAVTDEASLEQIAVLRYNLATYRQIFDPLKPSQDRHMVASWKAFVENEWFDIFQGLCEAGLLHEARLLWQRHREIAECMKDLECCNKILGAFGVTIDKDLNAVQAAVELLEGEMIPLALLNQDDEMCDQMIEWIIGIAEHLERVLPDEFPDNSLWVSRAMERAIDSTISNSVTPLDQSRLMYTLSKIRSDAQDVRMGRLNAYAHSLAVMAKLKAVYGLKMSHQTYRDQNVQTICYLILERIKAAAEKIREQVSRFAIPYMDEYKLNKDETLYEYINTVTGENVFTATSSGNPWDERCLEISKAIGNTHVRCRAIIDIARRSCPPWTTSLTAAVNSMLQIPTLDKELIKELHRQCQQAEFGQILLRYEIPLSVLDSSIQYSRSFAAIIKKVCHPREDVEQQIAVADALELVALHKKLAPTATEVKPEAVYTFFAEAVVAEEVLRWLEADKKAEMDHAQLIAFMDVVPAELRHAVAAQLAEKHFIRLEAYPASKKSSGEKKRRLALISTNLCLLQRYYQCADKTRLIDVLGAIRSLQLHFNNYVGPSFFESEERYAFFTATLSRMTEWSWPQVVNVATALLLDQGEACRFAMDTAVRQQVSPVLTLTMVREYTSIHTEVTDSFLETSVKCIDYALSRFSSMAAEQRQGTAANGSVVDCVELLHEILPTLLNSIEASAIFYKDSRTHPWFVKISRVSRYIEIFMQFLEQSFYGENADRMEVDDQPDASVNESEIYGIQSRVGVYSFRRDGAIYDRDEGIPLLASVATAMLDGELQQAEGDQRINWRQLFEFFTGYQQSILEITSCCLAASVTQNSEASWAYVADCYQSICNACTKILAVPKNADLWLATAIIELLAPEEAGKISMELRKWAVQKKNPRITVNALRVFQRKTIMTEDNKLWIQYSVSACCVLAYAFPRDCMRSPRGRRGCRSTTVRSRPPSTARTSATASGSSSAACFHRQSSSTTAATSTSTSTKR